MQSILLLIAPALLAASIYMVLGRIVLLTEGERHSLIPQRWLTKVFVAGDVVSFLTQGAGGGILGGSNNNKSQGKCCFTPEYDHKALTCPQISARLSSSPGSAFKS